MNPRKLPFRVRQLIVEFLGPSEDQLEDLDDLNDEVESAAELVRFDGGTMTRERGYGDLADRNEKKLLEARQAYQIFKDKIYSQPSIWETYQFFWDDSINFFPKPDDDKSPPGAGSSGQNLIST